MWVFTTKGYYSVGVDTSDDSFVWIRSRTTADLQALMPNLPTRAIESTPDRDYQYRVKVTKARLVELLASEVVAIDYTKFKTAVANNIGQARYRLYLRVWDVLCDLVNTPDNRVTREKP